MSAHIGVSTSCVFRSLFLRIPTLRRYASSDEPFLDANSCAGCGSLCGRCSGDQPWQSPGLRSFPLCQELNIDRDLLGLATIAVLSFVGRSDYLSGTLDFRVISGEFLVLRRQFALRTGENCASLGAYREDNVVEAAETSGG